MAQKTYKELNEKWSPVLDTTPPGFKKVESKTLRKDIGQVLENTFSDSESMADNSYALQENAKVFGGQMLAEAAPTNSTGGAISNYDPVLISMIRRAMPNMVAYDIMGVQPMTGPTGLIFAMRSRYGSQTGPENFYNEVNTAWSSVVSGNGSLGQGPQIGGSANAPVSGNTAQYNYAGTMGTSQAEALGSSGNTAFPEVAFSIEKVPVVAGSRALQAKYSIELAQDLKAIHGLDAQTELANIVAAELLAEINREMVRTVNVCAAFGAQDNVVTAGTFDLDTDSNGRWSEEKWKGLLFQIERECNAIAKATRRGKGNLLICSSDVASALTMTGKFSYAPALQGNDLQVDDTGITYAGILNNRIKVYIDPYAAGNYMTVGYRGTTIGDAGIIYSPYVPIQMMRAIDPNTFQPAIGFKTRYGVVANPFAQGATAGMGALVANSNVFYRKLLVNNLM